MGYRSKAQKEKDYAMIAELYCKGYTQEEIAEALNERPENPKNYRISQPSVSLDLKAIRQIWLESALLNFDTRVAEEVAKVDQLERMWHQAYVASLKPQLSKKSLIFKDKSKKPQGHKIEGYVEEDSGDSGSVNKITLEKTEKTTPEGNLKCLDGIAKCIELRAKLLGIVKNNIDLTSKGEKLENKNIIILPSNNLNDEVAPFNEERIKQMIAEVEKGEQSSDE